MIEDYYNALAPQYRLLFEDWDASVKRQAVALDDVIRKVFGTRVKTVLDAACGIGTQSIGLAQRGYEITGSDLSSTAITQATIEAARRGLEITFGIADMRELSGIYSHQFDLVIACDNAIPHLLSDAEILRAFEQFHKCTGSAGGCIISVRDYDNIERGGSRLIPRQVHRTGEGRVLVFDLWEFEGDYYDFTTYIIEENDRQPPITHVYRGGRYYCVTLRRLAELLKEAGFKRIDTLREGYYQPLLIGSK